MKRRDAFRKIRRVCERLDAIDKHTFPIWPLEVYVFGSVLTDKEKPKDIDLALVYKENPEIHYTDAELSRMIFYEPRLQPQNRAIVELRRGMKFIQIYTCPESIARWEYLPMFADGEGLRLIWKPEWAWQSIVDNLEAHPMPWTGDRTEADEERLRQQWEALSDAEKQQQKQRTLMALRAQGECHNNE